MGIASIVGFISAHPLTRNHRLAALARVCVWQARSRLRDEIAVPWVSGTKLVVSRSMTGATGNIYVGLHEFSDMGFTLHFLRPSDVFVDVGANVGSYTVLASGVCGAKSIAVEPDQTTMKHLRLNLEINRLRDMVVTELVAIGAHEGFVNFSVGLDCINHVVIGGMDNVQQVHMKTLDKITASVELTMIKIDVEGYEAEVLMGAKETLQKPSLKVVLTENHSPAVTAPLVAAGFERYRYDPFGRTLRPAQMEEDGNALFVRDLDLVEDRISTASTFRVLNRDI
jgi:FkbM family methyltransferase